MKKPLLLALCCLLFAGAGRPAAAADALEPPAGPASPRAASLGYVVLYVKDVAASLAFYEKAFGLSRRFFNDDQGMAYGELETGAARLAFYNFALAATGVKAFTAARPDQAPLGVEIALVTPDVRALYARALKAGALSVSEPAKKPGGQTVACVRDNSGFLVELTSPMP